MRIRRIAAAAFLALGVAGAALPAVAAVAASSTPVAASNAPGTFYRT